MTVRRARPDDAGFTLMEVLVGLLLMCTVMALSTAGMYVMYRTANRSDAAAEVQTQTAAAFNRLDRQIRYAKRIFPPRAYGTDFTVSYLVTQDGTTTDECVQLRLQPSTGKLMTRRWEPPAHPGTFTIVAEKVAPVDGNTAPFVVPDLADSDSNYDVLRVRVKARAGGATNPDSRLFEVQYTALNTVSYETELGTTCTAAP